MTSLNESAILIIVGLAEIMSAHQSVLIRAVSEETASYMFIQLKHIISFSHVAPSADIRLHFTSSQEEHRHTRSLRK